MMRFAAKVISALMWGASISFVPLYSHSIIGQEAQSAPETIKPLKTNDLALDAQAHYTVKGKDPFFVFDSNRLSNADNPLSLFVPLILQNIGTVPEQVKTSVFFDGKQSTLQDENKRTHFDARKRIDLTVNAEDWLDSGGLNIELDQSQGVAWGDFVRIDIEQCSDCRFKLSLRADAQRSITPKLQSIRFGLQPLNGQIRELDPSLWRRNDTDTQGVVVGADPFFVSPELDTATNQLAGVFFILTSQAPLDLATFQLFYATERHGFIEQASQTTKVTLDKQNEYAFFLPLDFLSLQFPNAQILEQIRLDAVSSLQHWSIKQATLIPSEKSSVYQAYRPALFTQTKMSRPSVGHILRDIYARLMRDPLFLLLYSILILTAVTVVWRRLKIAT